MRRGGHSTIKYGCIGVPLRLVKRSAFDYYLPIIFIINRPDILSKSVRPVPVLRGVAMFVCVCNAVTDRQIQETVAAGARSLGELQSILGVATCCGCCTDLAVSFLDAAGEGQMAAGGVSAVEH